MRSVPCCSFDPFVLSLRPAVFGLLALLLCLGAPLHADWKATSPIALSEVDSNVPAVVVDAAGALHAVWHDGEFLGDSEVLYATRPVGGLWSVPESVSGGATTEGVNADVAVDTVGGVHVVWREDLFFQRSIFYAERVGGVWSEPEKISSEFDGTFPRLLLGDDGAVYAYWETSSSPDEIVFAERPAGGSWLPAVNLTQTDGNSSDPELFLDGENLELFYIDRLDETVFDLYRAERPAGSALTEPELYYASSVWSDDFAYARDSDGTLHLAWREGPPSGSGEIFYAERPVGGVLGAPVNVSQSATESSDPAVLVSGSGAIHIAYEDFAGGSQPEIFHVQRPTPGAPWSRPDRVSDTPSGDFGAKLLEVGDQIQLYWWSAGVTSQVWESIFTVESWSQPEGLADTDLGTFFSTDPVVDPFGTVSIVYSNRRDTEEFLNLHYLRNDGPVASPPVLGSFQPDGGTGTVGVPTELVAVYSDPNAAADIERSVLVLNTMPQFAGGVALAYDRAGDRLVLFEEDGSGLAGSCTPGADETLAHSYVTVACETTRVDIVAEDELHVFWNLRFTACPPAGCGTYSAFLFAEDFDGQRGGPAVIGQWTLEPGT